jgi:hypothetical protein
MRRSLPDCDEADLYWGLHFALAMAHQTIRDTERLTKLSDGQCDVNNVEAVIERVVDAAAMTLSGRAASARNSELAASPARRAEKLRG